MGLFSEARKYNLFVTIAQQSVAQLSEQSMLNTILDNVGTMVAFRSKSPETEKLLLHQFSPYVDKGEILKLPAYNFYLKIAAVQPQEPLSGETVVLPKGEAGENRAEKVVAESRERWAIMHVHQVSSKKQMGKDNVSDAITEDESERAETDSDGLLGDDVVA